VVTIYCSSRYSLRSNVLKTFIVHSPPAALCQVAFRIFKDLSIPYPDRAFRWATWSAVAKDFGLLHLALGFIAYSCCVNSIQGFFRRHMYIIRTSFAEYNEEKCLCTCLHRALMKRSRLLVRG
jgi:hypothetical protein